jgi:hypothetical protein
MAERQTGVRRVWTATVRRAIGTPRRGRSPIVLPLHLSLAVEIQALPEVWDAGRGPCLVRLIVRDDVCGLIGGDRRCARMAGKGVAHASKRLGSLFVQPGKFLSLRIPQLASTGLSALVIRASLKAKPRRAKRPVLTVKTPGATP